VYRNKIKALASGKPFADPSPAEVGKSFPKVPNGDKVGASTPNVGKIYQDSWDSWGDATSQSQATQQSFSNVELQASMAQKDQFFAKKLAENSSRPEGVPPSQGGKYVGFGSGPIQPARGSQDDVLKDVSGALSKGFQSLSLAAAGVAKAVGQKTQQFASEFREGEAGDKISTSAHAMAVRSKEVSSKAWSNLQTFYRSTVSQVSDMSGFETRSKYEQLSYDDFGSYQSSDVQNNHESRVPSSGWGERSNPSRNDTGYHYAVGNANFQNMMGHSSSADNWAGWDVEEEDASTKLAGYSSTPQTAGVDVDEDDWGKW